MEAWFPRTTPLLNQAFWDQKRMKKLPEDEAPQRRHRSAWRGATMPIIQPENREELKLLGAEQAQVTEGEVRLLANL